MGYIYALHLLGFVLKMSLVAIVLFQVCVWLFVFHTNVPCHSHSGTLVQASTCLWCSFLICIFHSSNELLLCCFLRLWPFRCCWDIPIIRYFFSFVRTVVLFALLSLSGYLYKTHQEPCDGVKHGHLTDWNRGPAIY